MDKKSVEEGDLGEDGPKNSKESKLVVADETAPEIGEKRTDPSVSTENLPICTNLEGSSSAGISPSTKSPSEIRRRSSSSQRRNYRVHRGTGSQSNSSLDEAEKSGDESQCTTKAVNSVTGSSAVAEDSNDSHAESPMESDTLPNPNSCNDHEQDHSVEEQWDSDIEHEQSAFDLAGNLVFENGNEHADFSFAHESMSSSSSDDDGDGDGDDLNFMEDDDVLEDDSSDSSDSLLEDLDAVQSETATQASGKTSGSKVLEEKKKNIPPVLLKPKPKCTWSGPREVLRREIGYGGRVQSQSAEIFRSKFYGSLYSAERLELMHKLDGHSGCVNCLNFNYSGTKLASGSDDLQVKIWNYGLGKLIASFNSGHKSNVFQAKFLPLIGIDNMIVTCARDSHVRLTQLDSAGDIASSRVVARHKGAVHKLSVSTETPQVILSCGEDGAVFSIDIREETPQKLLIVREKSKKVALYSIHGNPLDSHEFCVCGRDEYVRIYDTRKLSSSNGVSSNECGGGQNGNLLSSPQPLKRFCPHHLKDSQKKPHVTAAVYNYNGKQLVGSYNDENIYLFDATHSDGADCIKVYEGHRNCDTVKGVNFFGDKSQFVVSGSDCGHVFMWDKETESIVNFFRGDENGVVNCLEPHPSAPILATSGLDDDVKIWIPSSEKAPQMGDLAPTVKKNLKKRDSASDRQSDDLDGQIMYALWSHLRRANRARRAEGGGGDADADSDDSLPDDDDNDEDGPRGADCVIC